MSLSFNIQRIATANILRLIVEQHVHACFDVGAYVAQVDGNVRIVLDVQYRNVRGYLLVYFTNVVRADLELRQAGTQGDAFRPFAQEIGRASCRERV